MLFGCITPIEIKKCKFGVEKKSLMPFRLHLFDLCNLLLRIKAEFWIKDKYRNRSFFKLYKCLLSLSINLT